jgi:membrane protein implicated in regulation of membrane protease activity
MQPPTGQCRGVIAQMHAWLIWLVAATALGVGEMHARGFFLAPLAAGALVAAGASLAGLGVTVSLVTFLVLSALMLRTLRPLALRQQRGHTAIRTGAAALIGRRAVVVERIANDESVGLVRIDGELWTARSFDDGAVIGSGEVVEVVAIRGATALVLP